MASSSFSKSSGDAPTLLPASMLGGEGVDGQTRGLRGFCEDAVAGTQLRQMEVAYPLHPERCPLHPSIAPGPGRDRWRLQAALPVKLWPCIGIPGTVAHLALQHRQPKCEFWGGEWWRMHGFFEAPW